MAVVTTGSAYYIDFSQLDLTTLLQGTVTTQNSTTLVVDYGGGDRDEFYGVGFTFNAFGEPTGGTITGYRSYIAGGLAATIEGVSASAAEFMSYVKNADSVGAIFSWLSGDDQISGGAFADFMAGGAGNDIILGFGGDDKLIGNAGQDVLNGGGGTDTAIYGAAVGSFVITKSSTGWTVTDKNGGYGSDSLIDVERIEFTDKTVNLQLTSATASTYASNILRAAGSAELSVLVANGLKTNAEALSQTIKDAGATTSVAILAYQFFTGKIPGQAGIDYLVSPTGPNANNLNSAYYQSFNLENRYINFAVNLGKVGEGKETFATKYGSLSLFDATREAYKTIFGVTPTDAKIHALIDTRADYFASYGGDGVNGQGTKAAMVGWLLAEAVKADVGMYAKANDAFLTDLADGATFAVDLVGVYGKPEYANF